MTKIAAVQMASGPHVQANLMEAGRLIKEAALQDADMVVLPENFAIMGMNESDHVKVGEKPGDGPIQQFISQQAKKHGVWIVAGTIPIQSDVANKVYASCLLYSDKGKQVARYDKMHLFDVEISELKETYTESDTTIPGTERVVVDTPLGKIGLAICYDLRFPEHFRAMVAEGAQIFVLPAAFTEVTGRAHWEILARARALENLSYLVASAQGGYHVNGKTTYGHTMVVDFWGGVRDELGKGTGVIIAEIDLKTLNTTRRAFPVLEHRVSES
jgi:nitrilase